jgi:hypothetical protein
MYPKALFIYLFIYLIFGCNELLSLALHQKNHNNFDIPQIEAFLYLQCFFKNRKLVIFQPQKS